MATGRDDVVGDEPANHRTEALRRARGGVLFAHIASSTEMRSDRGLARHNSRSPPSSLTRRYVHTYVLCLVRS